MNKRLLISLILKIYIHSEEAPRRGGSYNRDGKGMNASVRTHASVRGVSSVFDTPIQLMTVR